MNFASDNWAGAHPAVAQALVANAGGFAPAYGKAPIDLAVTETLGEIFEREVGVFFVSTGTAANALAMAAVNRAGGVAFCHREAHLIEDECGAAEYFTGGARLCPVDGPEGRMTPAALEAAIARYPAEFLHAGRPMGASITQATEIGTVYPPQAIDDIAAVCGKAGIPLHMDGARFANALVALGLSPAEMTWKRGVDLLSFGGTKNGCWCAEALVVFDPALVEEIRFLHKRAAQLFSKSRFVAAQLEAYLRDGLWLDNARHANAMAARLAALFEASPLTRLAWKPDANEVFAVMSEATAAALRASGAVFYPWHAPNAHADVAGKGEIIGRFVASFATTEADIEGLAEALAAA